MTIFKANLRLVILFYFWLHHLTTEGSAAHTKGFFDRLSNPDLQGLVSLNTPKWLRWFYMSIN